MSIKTLSAYISVMSQEQFERLEDMTLGISIKSSFSASELEDLEYKLREKNKKEELLLATATRNNEGRAFEMRGDLATSIRLYEENIATGYPATFSYERLMVLYKKNKQPNDEIRVVEKAIKDFEKDSRYKKEVAKWKLRLQKIKVQK